MILVGLSCSKFADDRFGEYETHTPGHWLINWLIFLPQTETWTIVYSGVMVLMLYYFLFTSILMPVIRYWAFKNKLKRLNKIPYLVQNLDASEGGFFHQIPSNTIRINLDNYLPAQETIVQRIFNIFQNKMFNTTWFQCNCV